MRKICSSGNTSPTASLMARADFRSLPMGFSSTTRDFSPMRPWLARFRQIEP